MRGTFFAYVLLVTGLVTFSVAYPDWECPVDHKPRSPAMRIRNHLFCDYDRSVRPAAHHGNATMVLVRLMPKFVDFDDHSRTLQIHSWLYLMWVDDFLVWTKEDFDGVSFIHINSQEVWVPDFSVYNSGDMTTDQSSVPGTDCVLFFDGMVSCTVAVRYVTRCSPNYAYWPFDVQNCTVRLGSWTHAGEEIDFDVLDTDAKILEHYRPNPEWDLRQVNVTKHVFKFKRMNETYPYIHYHFILERHSGAILATVIVPAIVLVILSMTTLWLDSLTIERMVLAGLNVICHFLCIQNLDWQIPFDGASVPLLMIFHRDSCIIAGIVVVLTVLLRALKQMSIPAPLFLSSMTSAVLTSKIGQIVLLSSLDPKASATIESQEDNADLVQSNSDAKIIPTEPNVWHHVSVFLDRISFVAIGFTYIIMIIKLFPTDNISLEREPFQD